MDLSASLFVIEKLREVLVDEDLPLGSQLDSLLLLELIAAVEELIGRFLQQKEIDVLVACKLSEVVTYLETL